MLEQEVTVVAVEGELAWVEGERKSACGKCGMRGGCGTGILQSVFSPPPVRFPVRNSHAAEPGDQVIIGVPESAFLKGSLLAYLMPILALILGAYLGEVLFAGEGQVAAIVGGVGGLFAALYWLRRRFRNPIYHSRYQPRMLRRLERGGVVVQPPFLS